MKEHGPLGSRSLARKVLHIAFWTALFYGLTVALAKFLEWARG